MQSPVSAATVEVRRLPAGRGLDWISEGFDLFRQAPGTWIGILVVYFLVMMLASIVPLLGTFLNPVLLGGVMLGCLALSRGEGLQVGHLFAAFKGDRVGNLLLTALIQIGLAVAVGVVIVVVVLAAVQGVADGSPADLERLAFQHANPMAMVLMVLLVLALTLPLIMLAWFAPVLVVLRGQDAWPAMKLSLHGCLRNWIPFLLYGLVALVLLFVGALPLLLGLLVVFPVMLASIFTSYRDIFPEPPAV